MIKVVRKKIKIDKSQKLSLVVILLLAVALPVFIWGLINQNLDIRKKAAGCSEQCPGSDGVLRNCTPPESDGSSADSLCAWAGRVESCGGQQFCCPKTEGGWTTDMSACAPPYATECEVCGGDNNIQCAEGLTCLTHAVCTEPGGCQTPPPGKCVKNDGSSICPTDTPKAGDVNNDGKVNIVDIGIIVDNYQSSPPTDLRTDLNKDSIVNIVDIGIVIDNYEL